MDGFNGNWLVINNLLVDLKRDFIGDLDVNGSKIEVHSYRIQTKEILIVIFLTLLPYCLFLIFAKGNFSDALNIWPVCLIVPFLYLALIFQQLKYDNHVVFDISAKAVFIKSNPIFGSIKRENIPFAKIDSLIYTKKRENKVVYNILSLKLKSGEIMDMQEFSSAEEVSHILNRLLHLVE